MDEQSTEQRKRSVFSSREIFYFFFALLVFGALAFIASEEWSYRRERTGRKQDAKFAKSREAALAIGYWGGYIISDSQVLYFDGYGQTTNLWLIYDIKKDETADGHRLARALDQAGPYSDALTNLHEHAGHLSGYKGNLVFTTQGSSNRESLVFQWRTNSDELQVFKWSDLKGDSKYKSAPWMRAFENEWFSSQTARGAPGGTLRIGLVGHFDRLVPFTNIDLPNPQTGSYSISLPFQDGVYITTITADKTHVGIRILSLAQRSLVFSNSAVEMPCAFNNCYGLPDPSGRRVLWMLEVESKFNEKLRSILPAKIAPRPAPPTWYLYSSDLHATKFKYVCAIKTDQGGPNFLWGPNGDSIWLLDDDEGIKRIELK